MMKMSADFVDFLRLLTAKGVDYLIIGGYAVGHYGYVRNTGDFDIWIRLTDENTSLTAEALEEFGYAPKEESLPFLKDPGKILRMGMPPFRIEVSTSIDGVEFDDCFPQKETVEHGGMIINFIGYDDLIANKKASGRLKDLADVEELEKVNE
jgi:predicted nucleotidyltransferase